jgi:hypothetical protein
MLHYLLGALGALVSIYLIGAVSVYTYIGWGETNEDARSFAGFAAAIWPYLLVVYINLWFHDA